MKQAFFASDLMIIHMICVDDVLLAGGKKPTVEGI